MRTDANAAGWISGSPAHATHIGGAPGTIVTPWSVTRSSVVTGSNRGSKRTLAPAASGKWSETLSPNTWKTGRTPSTTSSAVMGSGADSACFVLASNDPCVSMGARGAPTVTLVNTRTATSSAAMSATETLTAAPAGSTADRTSVAPTAPSSPSISALGLSGLSGTAIAPSPSSAKYITAK